MNVSFIMPVYNQIDLTRICLDTLQKTVPEIRYEIIVIDDCSDTETADALDALSSQHIKVLHNDSNLGYAKSNNIGVAAAQGEYLFLINNDLAFKPGWFEPMWSGIKQPKIGIVGNIQKNASTGEIDHAGFLFDGNGRFRHKRSPNSKRKLTRFDAVTGACLAIRRKDYLAVGGLDEIYENGCEDIDLCFKVRETGLKVVVANQSVIDHNVSSTRGDQSLRDERNTRLFQAKWRDEILSTMTRAWPATYLKNVREGSEPFNWELVKEAVARILPNRLDPSPSSTLRIESKLKRNERHWMSILDNLSDEMIKQHYLPNSSHWNGTQFSYDGFESTKDGSSGRWIREKAKLHLDAGFFLSSIQISGTIKKPAGGPEALGTLGLRITTNGVQSRDFYPLEQGDFNIELDNLPAVPESDAEIEIELLGTRLKNAYAYLGRVTRKWFLLPRSLRRFWKNHRDQLLNQRLVIKQIKLNHEMLLDFDEQALSPVNFDFLRRSSNIGINLIGWFDAELGVGESARLAAKALDTTSIGTNFLPLKVNCLASRGDQSLSHRLDEQPTYPINVFHIDAPQSADIDHHHGASLREGRRNIGYWAWELPEFPDNWIQYFKYFDEIWTPSNFVRDAVIMKSPLPVITIPHCIDFRIPEEPERAKFNLPDDKFLFLFAYDLNSYQPRKNPLAVIEAFKNAFGGSAGKDVGLVIKTHSVKGNKAAFEELQAHLAGIENTYLIENRLSREDVYSLMYSVDSYVSLHRAEGFGLTVAESMFLGKPVLSTNWSATTEFLDASNGCPVDYELVELEENHGPYTQGQVWADPSPEHAAKYMQKLFSDSQFAKEIGETAALSIRGRFSPFNVGKIYEKRMKSLALW